MKITMKCKDCGKTIDSETAQRLIREYKNNVEMYHRCDACRGKYLEKIEMEVAEKIAAQKKTDITTEKNILGGICGQKINYRKYGSGYSLRLNENNTRLYVRFNCDIEKIFTCTKQDVEKISFQNELIKKCIVEVMEKPAMNLDVKDIIEKEQLKIEEEKRRKAEKKTQEIAKRQSQLEQKRKAIEVEREKQRKEHEQREKQRKINKETKEILVRRKISDLVHITFVEINLPSIIEHGIRPRNEVKNVCESFIFSDEKRCDYKKNCICLSITNSNSYYFKDDKFLEKPLAKLFIDASILLSNNKRYYCHYNAAIHSISMQTANEELTTPADFEAMFTEEIKYTYSPYTARTNYVGHEKRKETVKDNVPTSIQAEILYQGTIEPHYIKRIVFNKVPTGEIVDLLKQNKIEFEIGEI